HCPAHHRTGRPDQPGRSAERQQRGEHGYRDVGHDHPAECLWGKRQGDQHRSGAVHPASRRGAFLMTTISGMPSGYGLLGRVLADSASVRNRLDTLTRQASSGLIADTYSGLGAGASVSLSIDPQVTALKTGQANIDAATGRMQVTQMALTQIQSIAASFQAQLMNLNGLNPTNVDSVAASARAALTQVAALLNTKDGDVYVFAGEDTTNPPVPNPDAITTSGFFTQIQSAVSQLSASGAA